MREQYDSLFPKFFASSSKKKDKKKKKEKDPMESYKVSALFLLSPLLAAERSGADQAFVFYFASRLSPHADLDRLLVSRH